ncbi:MAG: histidinol-phosphate transaminase [Planctomycetes bacterium]|nr:histidinol-phosphate transaminase [Planctomycetota bacterium]
MTYFRPEIEQMSAYMPGEQPQGGKFIKLNTNENPYPCSPAVVQAIVAKATAGLERYPDPMANTFRQRAGEVLGVSADWILCGNGSDEILTMLTRGFVGQGQLLRLPTPSYILYRALAAIQGAESQEVPFTSDWDLDERFTAADARLKLAFLPNPNSPSGTILAPARVLEIAQRLPCPLIVDEAYADFAETNCVSLVRECDKVIVTRTLSKSYALAGLRFGFLVAQPHIVANLAKLKDSYNCDALSIAAATAAIDDQAWLHANRAKVIASRARLTEGLRRLGFVALDSQSNFVWAVHPSRPAKSLYEALKAQRVLVRYMNYAGYGDGLRISVGSDEQNDACLALLGEVLARP